MDNEAAFEKLHVEHIPGTEIMRDVGSAHFVHGPKSHQVLIPRPSMNMNDPLNWKLSWKYTAIAVQCMYCWATVASALSIAPMFPLLAAEWDLSQTQLNLITGSCVLALGYANFVIVPISNILGRRFTSLVLALLVMGSCVWEARAQSYSSLIGARVVNGVATATSETLMVQVICDMFFLHERGIWMGMYLHGWRSFFWLSLALAGFNFLSLLLFFPETKYNRPEGSMEQAQLPAAAQENSASPETDKPASDHLDERAADQPLELQAQPATVVGQGSPSKAQFSLICKPDPQWKSFVFKDIISTVQVFFYPIIFWAGTTVAGFANLLLFWNLTESSVLGGAPYNFSVAAVGYANFAFVIGGFVGLFAGGMVSDWIAHRATVRNNGIRQAEMRLPALLPFFVLGIVAVVVGGLAEQHLWAWPVLIVVGYGISGMCITAAPAIAIAYAVDCYKPIAGEIMLVATVIKNTCGFSMSYWVPQLTAADGALTPAMVQLALTAGPVLFAVPLWLWGHKLRWWTRNAKVHNLEES
ncbi:hypothetical protein SEUCBS139899_001004 [Sporothrix eucalyptigena]|uniref:MFS transporter n=1 Tax=Sporothrix eucalyptigena TaxID=1812306 RepID=A0ABP0C850_9PEZI